jgi:MFS family permease
MVSKFGATKLYARFGFPRVLAATSILGSIFLAINGLFTPSTNHYLLMLALFVGGLTRSFFFTGVNTFGYADVSEAEASQATSIYAVAQQISVALGVAVAGGILEATTQLRGAPLDLLDFHIAWFIVAAIAVLSAIQFLRLPPDAGADVSGHRLRPLAKAEALA